MKLMAQFPATEQCQVTLSNWRTTPFNQWAYHHVRELLPTANIATRADGAPMPVSDENFPELSRLEISIGGGQDTNLNEFLAQGDTDGFLVLRGGKILVELYDHGHSHDQPHVVFSVSKSIVGLLTGILAGQGKIAPQAAVVEYIPEARGSAYGDCTIRHLLDMTVAIEFEEDYLDPDGDVVRYRRSTGWDPLDPAELQTDLRQFLLTLKRSQGEHGQVFQYVSPNTDMLGWVLERASGLSLASLLSEHLWRPKGAGHDAYVTVDRMGAPRAAGGICMTLRDMARVGQLMIDNGCVHGTQVVPEAWLQDIHKNGDAAAWQQGSFKELLPDGNYRSKWYQTGNDHGAFCAIGIHGQWIYCDPVTRVVIVRQASQPLAVDDQYDHDFLRACDKIARTAGELE